MFKSKRMIFLIISGVVAVQIMTSTVFNLLGWGRVDAANKKIDNESLPSVSESVYSTNDVSASCEVYGRKCRLYERCN